MVAYVAGKPAVYSASLGFQRAGGIAREGVQAIQDLPEFIKSEGGAVSVIYII